jgi:DNA-binding beta-propeller fold protein YncE
MLWLVVVEARPARAAPLCDPVPLYRGDIVVADPQDAAVPGMIVRVDARGEQAIVTQGENLNQPYGIAADSNGDLFVSDLGPPGRIVRIDRVTGAQRVVSEGQFFGRPYGIAIAPDGQIFITEIGTRQERHNRIIRVDPGTGIQTLVTVPSSVAGAFVDLEGIAVGAAGDLFVVDRGVDGGNDGRVIRVDPTTGEQAVVTRGGYLEDPRGIVADYTFTGTLIVADPDAFALNGAIVAVQPITGDQWVVSNHSLFGNPAGIAIDPTGLGLIVTDFATAPVADRVFRVSLTDGTTTVLSSSGSFFQPWGVAIVGGAAPSCTTMCCTLDAALGGPLCAGQTTPSNVLGPLSRALGFVDQADAATGRKEARLLRKAKAALRKAGRAALKAARGREPKLSAICASIFHDEVRRLVQTGLGR